MRLWTSRWQNRALETAPVVAVGISRGTPKFRVGYRYRTLPDLYPDGWMFGIEDDAKFNEAYRKKLERLGVDRIAEGLGKISDEEGGADLVLLCFEADPGQCHRSQFARWWEARTGQEVAELGRGCGPSHKRQVPQEPLF